MPGHVKQQWTGAHLEVGAFGRDSNPVCHDVVRRSLNLAVRQKRGHHPLYILHCAHWRQMSLERVMISAPQAMLRCHSDKVSCWCMMLEIPKQHGGGDACAADLFMHTPANGAATRQACNRARLKHRLLLCERGPAPNDAPDLRRVHN